MTNGVNTRRFQPTDAEAVIALWQAVLPSSQPWNDPYDSLHRKLNQNDDLVFGAENAGTVVGAVITGYDGVRGWIYSLAVAPEVRRRGIGRRLMDEAEVALHELGCPKVNLQVRATNSQVLKFYSRCGYATEARASLGKRLGKRLGTQDSSTTDPVPTIRVNESISLSQITWDDRAAYLKHLNETDEFRCNGIRVPFPYTEFDADRWISAVTSETLSRSHRRIWGIRGQDGELIGGVGLMDIKTDGKAECGYWLAKPFWGQGITTQVVRRLSDFAFKEFHLRRLQAHVFSTNPASARVLTKVGFRHEGTLRDDIVRDGQPIDSLIFGLLERDFLQ